MASETVAWDHWRTERLVLDHVRPDDVDQWYRIHADPRVWTHYPSGRHTDPSQTEELLRTSIDAWDEVGLSYWSVREEPGGPIIGCGGCRPVPDGDRWNLYYRFVPEVQGEGYATELARAAIDAANRLDPDRPVVAYMIERNVASRRVAEKAGLIRVWVGADDGNPDPTAIRLVYADRPDVGPG